MICAGGEEEDACQVKLVNSVYIKHFTLFLSDAYFLSDHHEINIIMSPGC